MQLKFSFTCLVALKRCILRELSQSCFKGRETFLVWETRRPSSKRNALSARFNVRAASLCMAVAMKLFMQPIESAGCNRIMPANHALAARVILPMAALGW